MNAKPEITDAEIRDSMDFDKVLKLAQVKNIQNGRYRIVGGTLGLIGLVLMTWIVYRALLPQKKAVHPATDATTTIPVTPSVADREKPATSLPSKKIIPSDRKLETSTAKPSLPATREEHITKITVEDVYSEAEPLDGFPALYEYFNQELKYPAEALKDFVQGAVTVKFVINESGKPEQIKIANPLNDACDHEAIRLIENMPHWKPARLNGKAVPSRISVPITFSIDAAQPH